MIPPGFNELAACRFGPMLYNKNDIYVGGSLRAYGEFSLFEHMLFEQLIVPGDVVVEVGANIGAHTVQLSRMVGSDGMVHAYEPQRIVFQTLCANLALNQCANVNARQVAVGAEEGQIMVPDLPPSQRTSFGSVELSKDFVGGQTVHLITVDCLGLERCNFLKIDVEGMEIDVLLGAQHTIESCKPLLYVENDRADQSHDLIELVQGLGYSCYWHFPPLFNPDNFAGNAENIFPQIVSVNMLCAPGEAKVDGLRPVASPTEDWKDAFAACVGEAL